jgi:hypothetical protein
LGECSIVVAELYMGCMDWFEVWLGSRISTCRNAIGCSRSGTCSE